jgi:hypothetical protein
MRLLIIPIFYFVFFSSCDNASTPILKKDTADSCQGFWYKKTYYTNQQVHTSTLLTNDTVPIKILSFRENGSIEAEFLFGKNRDTLGYGLAIFYDSTEANKIENVEVVGISTSSYWKGNTLFYRQKELMKIDSNDYHQWSRRLNVEGKNYYFDW